MLGKAAETCVWLYFGATVPIVIFTMEKGYPPHEVLMVFFAIKFTLIICAVVFSVLEVLLGPIARGWAWAMANLPDIGYLPEWVFDDFRYERAERLAWFLGRAEKECPHGWHPANYATKLWLDWMYHSWGHCESSCQSVIYALREARDTQEKCHIGR